MKILKLITVASSALLISGCANMAETFFAHIVLDDGYADLIARGNATVNVCMAEGRLDKNMGYAFNSISAQILDITVIDRDLYKKRYERYFNTLVGGYDVASECAGVQRSLPAVIPDMARRYDRMAGDLNVMRTQERTQMATMLSNFGSNLPKYSYATNYSWPKVNYVEKENQPMNWVVHTSNGMIQCRTTSKNHVFCM